MEVYVAVRIDMSRSAQGFELTTCVNGQILVEAFSIGIAALFIRFRDFFIGCICITPAVGP